MKESSSTKLRQKPMFGFIVMITLTSLLNLAPSAYGIPSLKERLGRFGHSEAKATRSAFKGQFNILDNEVITFIGHYQAHFKAPRRDTSHGRIWGVTAKGFPSVAKVDFIQMKTSQLLDQLKSPERWVREQAKRLLFNIPKDKLIPEAKRWISQNKNERHLVEILSVLQAHDAPHPELLKQLLNSSDYRIRSYATRVIGYWYESIDEPIKELIKIL